jgi:hypothetical protein
MSVRDFAPHWAVALLFAAFWLSDTESGSFLSEWSRGEFGTLISRIIAGMYGLREPPLVATTYFGVLGANLAYLVSSGLFVIAFLFASSYDNGWRRAVGLLLIAIVLRLSVSVCLVALSADETGTVRGTVAIILMIALMLVLAFQVTWFGLLGSNRNPL